MAKKKYSYTYKYRGVDYKSPTTMIIGIGGLALVGVFAYMNWSTLQTAFEDIINSVPKL